MALKAASLFLFLKLQYQMGNYNNETLKQFVVKDYLTPEQYKEITGIDYVAD